MFTIIIGLFIYLTLIMRLGFWSASVIFIATLVVTMIYQYIRYRIVLLIQKKKMQRG